MTARVLALGLPLAMLAGCERSKSASPLSPSVAGPIAGVTISAPRLLQPSSSAQIAVDQQPVTLVVENANTNGVRPLSYSFEIATDNGFTTRVVTQNGVRSGDGRTSFTLPQPLTAERTYYWRAKADDGANASDYSASGNFRVFTPVVIQAPEPREPAGGVTLTTNQPTLIIGNSARSGPAGSIWYLVEVATDATMASRVVSVMVDEISGQTAYRVPDPLAYSTRYFWRLKAFDPGHESNYSGIQTFVTVNAPVVAPPPTPTPTPSPNPSIGGDQINMAGATILNSPADLASWPVTSNITRLELRGNGMHVEFNNGKQDGGGRWPDIAPPGWSGALQFTLGMCLNINSRWYCSAVVEFWHGLDEAGGPANQVATNWFYDAARWAPMTGHQPSPGETVGFFVCAGDCRNNTRGDLSPARERTNVVLIQWPSSTGAFTFAMSPLASRW